MFRQRNQKMPMEIGCTYAVLVTDVQQFRCRPEACCLLYHRQLLAPERLPQVSEALVSLKETKVYEGIYEVLKHAIADLAFCKSRWPQRSIYIAPGLF